MAGNGSSPRGPERKGSAGKDRPKSSLSISTDPASDSASESAMGSEPGKKGPMLVSVQGKFTSSTAEGRLLVAVNTGPCGEEERTSPLIGGRPA